MLHRSRPAWPVGGFFYVADKIGNARHTRHGGTAVFLRPESKKHITAMTNRKILSVVLLAASALSHATIPPSDTLLWLRRTPAPGTATVTCPDGTDVEILNIMLGH